MFRETMLSKVVCHVRNVRAERTCKIFLARMNQHVNPEFVFIAEKFAADDALNAWIRVTATM